MSLFFGGWSTNHLMILSLFLSCSLRNDICSSRWFINLSDVSLVEFTWIHSPRVCLIHDWKNSFLKLLTSVKNEVLIFLNFCSFLSFSLNFWFSFGSNKHSWFPVIFSLIDWLWINNSKSLSKFFSDVISRISK